MASGSSIDRPDDEWPPARLIPASGIRGKKEQEERATAALLSVMGAVPSFGKAILSYMGAPAGRIQGYTEPQFTTDEGGTARPDGAVIVERGKTRWCCLVEVKTGTTALDGEQIDRYLQLAAREGYAGVLTVSNQIVSSPSDSPVRVNRRRLKKAKLRHLSWFRILTEAVIQAEHHGVEDPEQAWILRELISYLDDERSGASGYEGMGSAWVGVRNAARNRTLRPSDPGVREVCNSWEQLLEYMALRLRQNLGRPVSPVYRRGSNAASRFEDYAQELGHEGRLRGVIKVPDAIAPVHVEADLGARQVSTSIRVPAPKEGQPKTRIRWLIRQLKDAPPGLRVEVRFARTSKTTSLTLDQAREQPDHLLLPDDRKRNPTAFDVALTRDMGTQSGRGRKSFVADTMNLVLDFYGDVVQNLRKWSPRPPRLIEDRETEVGEPAAAIEPRREEPPKLIERPGPTGGPPASTGE